MKLLIYPVTILLFGILLSHYIPIPTTADNKNNDDSEVAVPVAGSPQRTWTYVYIYLCFVAGFLFYNLVRNKSLKKRRQETSRRTKQFHTHLLKKQRAAIEEIILSYNIST